jgi:hypothetical protein
MKSVNFPVARLSAALFLFLLSGCYKTISEPPEVVNGCRITAFGTSNGGTFYPGVVVSYNAAGNPVEFAANPPGQLNGMTWYDLNFRYDSYQRLTDCMINYADALGAVIWHRYSYPGPRTIIDSSYDYSDALVNGPPPTTSFDIYVDTLRLDDKDRIISDNDILFKYDRNGDLIRAGVTYDNKTSLWRTNAVLMFIAKDFSLHNALNGIPNALTPLAISNYNSHGLPLEFDVLPGGSVPTELNPGFIVEFSTDLQIQYDCSSRSRKD